MPSSKGSTHSKRMYNGFPMRKVVKVYKAEGEISGKYRHYALLDCDHLARPRHGVVHALGMSIACSVCPPLKPKAEPKPELKRIPAKPTESPINDKVLDVMQQMLMSLHDLQQRVEQMEDKATAPQNIMGSLDLGSMPGHGAG